MWARGAGVDEFHDTATGVWGEADSGGVGVLGEASGIAPDGSPAFAVAGYASDGGIGVYGESDTGFAMSAQGPTTQSRQAGAWVKAMVHVIAPNKGVPSIDRWFNSQGSGSFQVYLILDPGVFVVDFGFKIKDRLILSTTDFRTAYYSANNPKNLATGGWSPILFDANGNDLAHETLSLTPRVAIAMISPIDDTLVQVESFTLRMVSMGGGAFTPDYTRANHNVTLTVL